MRKGLDEWHENGIYKGKSEDLFNFVVGLDLYVRDGFVMGALRHGEIFDECLTCFFEDRVGVHSYSEVDCLSPEEYECYDSVDESRRREWIDLASDAGVNSLPCRFLLFGMGDINSARRLTENDRNELSYSDRQHSLVREDYFRQMRCSGREGELRFENWWGSLSEVKQEIQLERFNPLPELGFNQLSRSIPKMV